MQSAEVSLSKLLREPSRLFVKNCWLCLYRAPLTYHKSGITVRMIQWGGMLVEWPKLAPDWLFAQLLMKPIRVSTCLCHFHLICICKPSAPIAPRLHRRKKPICPSAVCEEQMADPVPANPALPDTLPCEKQHGPIAGCTVSSLTRRTSSTSAVLFLSSPAGFTAEQNLNQPLHPVKVRSLADPHLNHRW